jgi:hypothetical protein
MFFTTSQRVLIVIALVMLLWYVIGTWYSRRRGIRTLEWLREGLQLLGGQLQAAWIGSAASGARVAVNKANPPYQHLETTFILESREILPLWLVNLIRGKRDELIIKAHLRSPRRGEIEVVPSGSRLERSLRKEGQAAWRWQEGPHGLCLAHRGTQDETLITVVLSFLESYGCWLRRFSYRRDKPHLLLRIHLAGLVDRPSIDFFGDLTAMFTHP